MRIRRRDILGISAASLVIGAGCAQAQIVNPGTALQPHRIAYEVSLGPKSASQSISGARGLMVLEFTGSACDGYATSFRQVVELLDSDGSARNMDFRVTLFEDADAKRFRFAMLNRMQGQVLRDADGEARRRDDGSLSVVMKKPAGKKSDFDGDVLFPSAMTLAMIGAAQKGERSYQGKVFDGSESGEKIFDVNTTIGNKLEGERNQRVEEILRTPQLAELPRWPMTMAYFNDETGDRVPVYTLRAVVFSNGVMGDMNFQFPDFSLLARAVKYEPLKADPCPR
jgi:hypothetical protein